MIERLLYRGNLPSFYELKVQTADGREVFEEPEIIGAANVDSALAADGAREDKIYDTVIQMAAKRGESLSYSLRLMKPEEVRQFVRPFLWSGLYHYAVDRITSASPLARELGDTAFALLSMQAESQPADMRENAG